MKEAGRRRRQVFVRMQAIEQLMFVVLMSVTCCNLLPERMIWTKERIWWKHVVKSIFTSQDWLGNFRMSQNTFTYLRIEIQSSIEKRNTEIRRAVPTDMRVTLTLWFVAIGANYCTIGHLSVKIECLFGVNGCVFCHC